MTEASRVKYIQDALNAYYAKQGISEAIAVEVRGEMLTLEVIEMPLSQVVLNPENGRISAELEAHPDSDLVASDPYGDAAQAVVAELVRNAHHQVEELKENLADDGQQQPGVITRKGKLINGNTRCVVLRELLRDGEIKKSTMKVAVLPPEADEVDELLVEGDLQVKRTFQDDYSLVNDLRMIRRLRETAGLGDQAIAKRFNRKRVKVADLIAVLDLMERVRHIPSTPLPLTAFVQDRDQLQNWLELLKEVRDLENRGRPGDAENHMRGWLAAYSVGLDSVHKLRQAKDDWVTNDLLPDLAESINPVAVAIADSITAATPQTAPRAPSLRRVDDLLGDDDDDVPTDNQTTAKLQALVDLAVATTHLSAPDVTLSDGRTLPSDEVRSQIAQSTKRAFDAIKRRQAEGDRIQKPVDKLLDARKVLREAADALDDVIDEPQFAKSMEQVNGLLDELGDLLDRLSEATQTNAA